jgi:hypothetical protein
MCTGIIGHCQCLKCLDYPVPGKLLRVNFCDKQQEELAGIWTNFLPHERRLVPCNKLTFDRVRDPDSCHFKKNEVVQKSTSSSEPMDTAAGKEAGKSSPSSTTFTPINAAQVAIAKAALAVSTEKATPAETQDTATIASSSLAPGDTENRDKMAIDALCALSATNPASSPIPKPDTHSRQEGLASNNEPAAVASAAVTGTPTHRTPLPTSRPPTPRVVQATAAAAAAADTAGRVAGGGQWTHAETIKLLVLKAKGVEYEDMPDVSTTLSLW